MKFVKVKALKPVSNNGKGYRPGAEFEMEESLAAAHAKAGLVERVGEVRTLKPGEAPDESQAAGGVRAAKAGPPEPQPEPAVEEGGPRRQSGA